MLVFGRQINCRLNFENRSINNKKIFFHFSPLFKKSNLYKNFKKLQKIPHLAQTQTNNGIKKALFHLLPIGENPTWKFEFVLKLLIFKVVNITLGHPVHNIKKKIFLARLGQLKFGQRSQLKPTKLYSKNIILLTGIVINIFKQNKILTEQNDTAT